MNIYEIAELAGVSITTVSKVINGKSDIGEKTKNKVLRIMEEHNYKPKISAVNVRNIAVFGPLGQERLMSNSYLSVVLSGIANAVFNDDYSISLVPLSRVPRTGRLFEEFCRQRKIFGCIFVLTRVDDDYIAYLAEKLPIVVLARRFDGVPLTTLEADNEQGGYAAVKHLVDLGHKNILFIVSGMRYHDHVMRVKGGESALAEAGLVKHPDSLDNLQSLSDMDLGHYLRNVMQSADRPTAIFAMNDHAAVRTMRLLTEMGFRIPQDVSIVGYDDSFFSAHLTPPLTTVYQPTYDLGKEAGRTLISMMESEEERKPERIILKDTRLIIRGSTGLAEGK